MSGETLRPNSCPDAKVAAGSLFVRPRKCFRPDVAPRLPSLCRDAGRTTMDAIGDPETRPVRRNRTLERGLFVSDEKRDLPVSRRRIAAQILGRLRLPLLTTFAPSSRARGMIDRVSRVIINFAATARAQRRV